MSEAEYAILGSGAMGSIIGAHLARAGHSTVMLARGRRAQQLEKEGLRVKGLIEFTIPVRTLTDPAQLRSADVLIVATKAIDTVAALQPLRAAAIGVAFSVQNGVMKNELLMQTFGADRVLGALADTSGELLSSGEVMFTRNVNLYVGELSAGAGARAQRIASALDASGVRSRAVADIWAREWSKFAGWVGFMGLSITTRVNTWRFLGDADAALVLARLVREVASLARACGVSLTDESMLPVAAMCCESEQAAADLVRALAEGYRVNAPSHRLSTLQDLEAGRPLEIEETLGYAVAKAAKLNLTLPLLTNLYALARAIDRLRQGGGRHA